MALKPTIYKAQIALADSDRDNYHTQSLTLARHPSETAERLFARLLAYCLQYESGLTFTRGLSTTDEPDVWQHSDSGEILHWIEVGQPEPQRLRKACGRSARVSIYTFGASSNTWLKLNREALQSLPKTHIWQLDWNDLQRCTESLIARSVSLSVSIVGGVVYLDGNGESLSIEPKLMMHSD